jgi:hypothetical protein
MIGERVLVILKRHPLTFRHPMSGRPDETQNQHPTTMPRYTELIEFCYLDGYGNVPRCVSHLASHDFMAFCLALEIGKKMQQRKTRKRQQKLARA